MLVVNESPDQQNPSERIIEVSRPLPRDESLIANETTSLCRDDAERRFRVRLQVFEAEPPTLILICTEGYSNAFESPAGFEQVGGDMLRVLREQGVAAVAQGFAEELDHVSRVGSGDDVTVAVVFHDTMRASGSHEVGRSKIMRVVDLICCYVGWTFLSVAWPSSTVRTPAPVTQGSFAGGMCSGEDSDKNVQAT